MVDYFVDQCSSRYGVDPHELGKTIVFVRVQRDAIGKIQTAGIVSIVGLLTSALLLSLWEGIKALITGHK